MAKISTRNRKIKAGIIGFEGAGMALFRHFNSLDGCETRAVFDPKTDALDRARRFSECRMDIGTDGEYPAITQVEG